MTAEADFALMPIRVTAPAPTAPRPINRRERRAGCSSGSLIMVSLCNGDTGCGDAGCGDTDCGDTDCASALFHCGPSAPLTKLLRTTTHCRWFYSGAIVIRRTGTEGLSDGII